MATGTRAQHQSVIAVGTPGILGRTAAAARTWLPARIAVRRNAPAAERVLRRLGLSIGVGGIIMGLAELPEIAEQARFAVGWWTPVAVVLAFGLFPVLALVSVSASPRVIRLVSACAAMVYLAALASMTFAVDTHSIAATSVWLYRILVLGVLTAALAWPVPIAIGYLLVGSAAVAATNIFLAEPFTAYSVASAWARAAGLSALFLWCAVSALRAGIRVDHRSEEAGRQAAEAAAAVARDNESARFAALIHDAVLSTLLDASRGSEPSDVLRRQAEHTLEQLDEIRVESGGPGVLDASAAVHFLRVSVHEVNPGVRFATRTWPGFDDLRMPAAAARTVAAALAEAVRNSLRHASVPGRPVARTVTCTISAGSIRVIFADDGAGFDVGAVSADRLGISVSILGRMRQLPGGAGFVESQPGEGTTVTLVWGGDGEY
ncbi:putative two-component system sensor kinase [Nocardia nova SH22a]|uniref:Putative two-component system sensor kinase n=1 Tax=Nocardia nova SH22a TaxID=1415166 RepID=W5TSK9_9NOCA|nr:ATP-binding protein [Nocardia nova]AHH20206.1 putative two-component system sensor kinase [Nocardia nova SH22a]